jgi:hypothetical protein
MYKNQGADAYSEKAYNVTKERAAELAQIFDTNNDGKITETGDTEEGSDNISISSSDGTYSVT